MKNPLPNRSPDHVWDLAGYGLWVVGSALFAAAALRNGDGLSLVASLLFLVGILAVMVPIVRSARRRRP